MIINNINVNKLHQEFNNNGIYPSPVNFIDENSATFTFAEDVNLHLVQQIIDTHDPTPNPQPPSEIEKLRLEQAQANSELVQLIMMMGGV